MLSNKRLRVFAGPNGSGKSTLFDEFRKKYDPGYFINADEIGKHLAISGLIDINDLGIKSRYTKTLTNLFPAMQLTYRSYLFDNSGKKLQLIAETFKGSMQIKVNTTPIWFSEFVLPHYIV
jgi:predicted ABC-type ATPase